MDKWDNLHIAEEAMHVHRKIAFNDNPRISDGLGEVYRSSRRLLKATIRAAYPNLDTESIYDVWADCGESIQYCANYVRDNPEQFEL